MAPTNYGPKRPPRSTPGDFDVGTGRITGADAEDDSFILVDESRTSVFVDGVEMLKMTPSGVTFRLPGDGSFTVLNAEGAPVGIFGQEAPPQAGARDWGYASAANSPYTLPAGKTALFCDPTAGPVDVVLPAAATVPGLEVLVKLAETAVENVDHAHPVTFTDANGGQVESSAQFSIQFDREANSLSSAPVDEFGTRAWVAT